MVESTRFIHPINTSQSEIVANEVVFSRHALPN
jgi:hypothetical protein